MAAMAGDGRLARDRLTERLTGRSKGSGSSSAFDLFDLPVNSSVVNLAEELAWWRFYLPRQAVQLLARTLPLAALRDRLPRVVAERLRFGLLSGAHHRRRRGRVRARRMRRGAIRRRSMRREPVRYDAAPRVSILIVTYNNLSLTRLCLASIQRRGRGAAVRGDRRRQRVVGRHADLVARHGGGGADCRSSSSRTRATRGSRRATTRRRRGRAATCWCS